MNRSESPTKQSKPFAINGQREPILPTTPSGDNTASYEQGFPPITMILKSAGGLPPKGQDMNQILYELSALARWSSTGALNSYDSIFSSAIGGYPKGAFLISDDGLSIYINNVDSNATNPNSSGAGWVDLYQFLGLNDVALKSANNTFTGNQTFTSGVSLPSNTAYNGMGLSSLFDGKQDKDSTLTSLSGKSPSEIVSYLGLSTAAKTDSNNIFTGSQIFSTSVSLPSDTTLNGTGLGFLFDSKLNASNALGVGQTWQDVTSSRVSGVTYTNTTSKPICVSIPETGDGDRGIYVGGVLTAFARGSDSDSTLFAIVPPGTQYIFSGAFSSWAELR
ncbi:hypothetical protein ACY2PW_002524 [Salmonella enterica]